jgi:hypothetical protein
MLEGFERDDHVHAGIVERQVGCGSPYEPQIVGAVCLRRICDRCRIDLHSDNASANCREDGGAIALAGSDIEYVQPLAKISSKAISMKMLELRRPYDGGGHPFAGKLKRFDREQHTEVSVNARHCSSLSGLVYFSEGLWGQKYELVVFSHLTDVVFLEDFY